MLIKLQYLLCVTVLLSLAALSFALFLAAKRSNKDTMIDNRCLTSAGWPENFLIYTSDWIFAVNVIHVFNENIQSADN